MFPLISKLQVAKIINRQRIIIRGLSRNSLNDLNFLRTIIRLKKIVAVKTNKVNFGTVMASIRNHGSTIREVSDNRI
jgi:uncharacterized protein YutE (UPF0331/DUF86 family)